MPTPQLDDLLAHARWAERFARMLVRDGADDLAQDAWLAALRTPPANNTTPRAWLATVLRNAARMRYRSETRRVAREARIEEDARVASGVDAVQRMRLQRRLAELVLALDEARRTVVVLAFYDGKSAAEIGRELEIPPTTVRSRIASALETMRTQLDAEAGGDRSQWQLALAPLVKLPAPATATATTGVGALVVAACTVLLVVVAALVVTPPRALASEPVVAVSTVEPTSPVATAQAVTVEPAPRVPTVRSHGARTARPALPAATPAIAKPAKPITVSEAFERVTDDVHERIDECWRLVEKSGRDVKGAFAATITIDTDPVLDAKLALDPDNTITDPELLECLRDNPLAILEHIEQLRDADPRFAGTSTVRVWHPLPPYIGPPPPGGWKVTATPDP